MASTPCCRSNGATGGSHAADAAHWRTVNDVQPVGAAGQAQLRRRLVEIPGGFFDMGTRKSRFPDDLDSPRRKIRLSPFLISPCAVSNNDYARFVSATGYRTVAEREGWSYVFHLFLGERAAAFAAPPGLPWWRAVKGAFWAAPEGPGSDWRGRDNHPAVHICWYDALAYCNWAGLRLPTDAEWECAARGGLEHKKFPWGNAFMPEGQHAMNTWQGQFPNTDTGEDGYVGTAPVNAFAPNGFGLFNPTGNVWEWVSDFYGAREASALPPVDPTGPSKGYARIQRGGSYLCHVSYCDRYHVHSRTRNDPDSSAGHSGFRVAASV